jgi:hypothetical protein
MPPVTNTDCETKNYLSLKDKLVICNIATVTINLVPYIFGISFVCHQKPHSLQPDPSYGNLLTNIPKS